ncbi:hypothetical protein CKO23_09425 [Thiocystis violacea]|nr:hypothetical protein [Thiocystis violacea]
MIEMTKILPIKGIAVTLPAQRRVRAARPAETPRLARGAPIGADIRRDALGNDPDETVEPRLK